MPPREWKLRIEDVLQSISKIDRYTKEMTFDDFARDEKTVDAVIRNFQIIGEAARHLPEEIMSRYSQLPWAEMRGIRNVVVHEYSEVDLRTVWDTVQHDLPPLVSPLLRILHENT